MERFHNSLQSFLRPSLGMQKSKFLRVLKHTREYVTVIYNDHEINTNYGQFPAPRPYPYGDRKATFIKRFVHTIQKRQSMRQSITSPTNITNVVALLEEPY